MSKLNSPAVRRHTFFGVALFFALLLVALGSTSFQRKLASFQPLGFEASPAQGAFLVESSAVEALRAGDLIVMIDGEERPKSVAALAETLRDGAESEILVRRADELLSITYARPVLDVDFAYFALALIGGVYLLMGLYTAFRDQRSAARLFYLWSLTSAALYILSPPLVPADVVDLTIYLADQAARVLLPCLTLHLFLVFPSPLLPRRLQSALVPALYLPAALSLGFHVDQIFYDGARTGVAAPQTLLLVDRLELLLLVLFPLLAILALAMRMARRPDGESKQQMQWIFFGMAGGYLPFLALYVAPTVLEWSWPVWTELLGTIPLALVPLAFAWAILKHKLWDLSLVLRDSIAYTLTALVGLFGFSLIHLAIQQGVTQELVLARNLLTFAAGVAVAGVMVPTRNVIVEGLERLQHRGALGPRRALARLGQELLLVRDLDRLCDVLQERLGDALQVPVSIRLRGDSRGEALDFAELGDVFEREVAAISAVALPGEEPTAPQRLFADGYRYAFPLKVREHRLGLVLLGYKFGQEPLNSEEVDLVRGVVDQAALAIENAQLLSELGRQLDEVRRLERRTEGILEASPAGIALYSTRRSFVVSANQAFCDLAERGEDEVRGRSIEELLLLSPLPDPEDGLVEVSYCEPSGRERYFELSVAPHPGDVDLRVLVIQDVSDKRSLEATLQEKERLASLGMLAAGVAHEVNTPLTGISSYAQLLLADTDPEEPSYDLLKKVERQTFRAAQIVNNLLEFSRNRHDDLRPAEIGAVLEECVRLLSERFEDAAVELIWDRPEDSYAVLGNEGELQQVFTNLLVNALDALEGREIRRLTVGLAPREDMPDRVRATVSDTGPGIPPERIERIFQPFFSSKLGKGGTGLGLSITYNIVRRHRGEIRAANHVDAPGCTFTVDLPLHRS